MRIFYVCVFFFEEEEEKIWKEGVMQLCVSVGGGEADSQDAYGLGVCVAFPLFPLTQTKTHTTVAQQIV